MDNQGYVDVDALLNKIHISFDDLDHIVSTNDKKRFAYNDDKTKIRASQGHTMDVKIDFKPMIPPDILYHGTDDKGYHGIMKTGISRMSRQYVHLSDNEKTAYSVGKRYSKAKQPIILIIDALSMYNDGLIFFKSENNVWLTDNVPIKYITKKE